MLCHITVGRTTFVTAGIIAKCGIWNNNIHECVILLPQWEMAESYRLQYLNVDISTCVADGISTWS